MLAGVHRCLAMGLAIAATLFAGAAHARGGSPYVELPPHEEAIESSAYRYANLSSEEAFAELDRRGIPYQRESGAPGVRAPIRLAGPLHGVDIHSSLPPDERSSSMFEILDARLALALDDFAVILARHDVNELVHYTMYRPNVAPPGTPGANAKPRRPGPSDAAVPPKEEKPAKRGAKAKRRASIDTKAQKDGKSVRGPGSAAKNKAGKPTTKPTVKASAKAPVKPAIKPAGKPATGKSTAGGGERKGGRASGKAAKRRVLPTSEHPHGKWAPPGTRHPAGLAIDVGILKKSDGTYLNVAQHFRGKVGDKTCGDDVPEADTKEARELRAIICESREAGVFTYALTPNFDAPHFDHFHLEIKPGVMWFLYH